MSADRWQTGTLCSQLGAKRSEPIDLDQSRRRLPTWLDEVEGDCSALLRPARVGPPLCGRAIGGLAHRGTAEAGGRVLLADLGQKPPEIAVWERGACRLRGEDWSWQPRQ